MEFRKITLDDYESYHSLINDFRTTSFTKQQFEDFLKYSNYFSDIWLAVNNEVIVGTATVLYEQKLIFNTCVYAHIEDVCVKKEYRRGGIGKALIKKCLEEIKTRGCYKVTLVCSDENIKFYESCCLFKRGNQMCELVSNL